MDASRDFRSGKIDCQTAEEFLSFLSSESPLFNLWGGTAPFCFRGQGEGWKVRPNAFRPHAPLVPPEPHLAAVSPDSWTEYQMRLSELKMLQRFFSIPSARSLVNDPRGFCFEIEKLIGDHGLWAERSPWPSPDILEGLGIAQHYQAATRLIDFTDSPEVAAYFCVAHYLKNPEKLPRKSQLSKRVKLGRKDMVLWAVHRQKLSGEQILSKLVFDMEKFGNPEGRTVDWNKLKSDFFPLLFIEESRAGFVNRNRHAQKGVFVVRQHPDADIHSQVSSDPWDSWMLGFNRKSFAKYNYAPVYRLRLPASEAPALLESLKERGVTGARLFPGIEGANLVIREERGLHLSE